MKHIITIISCIILSFISINTYAQLNAVTHEEAAGYKTVWTRLDGGIRYMLPEGLYVLCGPTNNQFENTMATIILGDTKESAILSLEDLRKIVYKETELPKNGIVVNGYNNSTSIFKSQGTLAIHTDGVAGESYILWHMKKHFDKAKEAINNFQE